MVPLFEPGAMEWPDVPIHLAAVNRYMCRVAGETADGLRPHPMCTPRYITEVMLPAAADGAARAGRDVNSLEIAMKPLVATGPDEETLAKRIEDVRARIAFYASTPAYRPCFEIWGLDALTHDLSALSRAQRWVEMPALIDDEMLNIFAVVGSHKEVADILVDRLAGILDQVGFSTTVENQDDAETLRAMIKTVQAG